MYTYLPTYTLPLRRRGADDDIGKKTNPMKLGLFFFSFVQETGKKGCVDE